MGPDGAPRLTVVVLTWDSLEETRRCVNSVREHTDVPYELLIVDNGSKTEAAAFAAEAADRSILNATNRGFAPGMNQGLASAEGEFVAFCNNDTRMPRAWASTLLGVFDRVPQVGIVVPAVTAAGNPCTVRSEPGPELEVLLPFGEFPSGVVYVMRTETARALGGWGEEFPIASAEDLDLCFKAWANDLSIVLDERVLVDHTSRASVQRLEDVQALYRTNLQLFLDKWGSGVADVPRLEHCSSQELADNLGRAATAISWVRRLVATRDELAAARSANRESERRVTHLEQQLAAHRRPKLRHYVPRLFRRSLRLGGRPWHRR